MICHVLRSLSFFSVLTPCRFVDTYQSFGEIYCLQLQGYQRRYLRLFFDSCCFGVETTGVCLLSSRLVLRSPDTVLPSVRISFRRRVVSLVSYSVSKLFLAFFSGYYVGVGTTVDAELCVVWYIMLMLVFALFVTFCRRCDGRHRDAWHWVPAAPLKAS